MVCADIAIANLAGVEAVIGREPRENDAILAGGRIGWPAILSSLKSVLETGRPLAIKMEPPTEMMEAVRKAVAENPWVK